MTQPLLLLYAGDSLTDETFHPELTRYTQLLDANLPGLEPNYSFTFSNHAHGGWATHDWPALPGYGYLPTNINTEILIKNANIVTIMLGVNDHTIDSGSTAPRIALTDFTTYLEQIIDQIRAVNNGSIWNNAQAQIVLITPPPIVTTYNANGTTCHDNARLKTYADAVKSVATAKGTGFVDIYTPLWNDVGQSEATYGSKYTIGDGTHLNNAGHSFIYPMIRDAVTNTIDTTTQTGTTQTAEASIYGQAVFGQSMYGAGPFDSIVQPAVNLSANLPISVGLDADLSVETATAVELSASLPMSAGLIANLSPVHLPSSVDTGTTQPPITIGPSPDVIVTGNVDYDTLIRVYRLFTTPAGSVPFDRNFGVDLSLLDNSPSALEGALLVEYTQKLNLYFPTLTISQLTFTYQDSSIIPQVVIAYA